MITSISIDNFRCFSGFHWSPGSLNILLGQNGSGKTSVFDALERLRDVISGDSTEALFPADTLCKWRAESDAVQSFRLCLDADGGRYDYQLQIEHQPVGDLKNRIRSESLSFNGQPVVEFDGKEVRLHADDGSGDTTWPFPLPRSAISFFPETPGTRRLACFRKHVSCIRVFSPNPKVMGGLVKKPDSHPERSLANFAEWLFAMQAADFQIGVALANSLREAIRGFSTHRFAKVSSTAHELFVHFDYRDDNNQILNRVELSFDALSEGQRQLFAIYSILHAAVIQNATVCIDEPDNYVALREIQPWLSAVQEATEDHACQILIISHHPELINQLAAHSGTLFERSESGTTTCRRFEWKDQEHATPAELVARGWE
ncbi:MAG: AAA family ATPase [Planctomycetaceae bacterium]